MMDELIVRLIGFVESTAPAVWEIAQKQVAVQVVNNLLWVFVSIACGVVCLRFARVAIQKYKDDTYSAWDLVGGLLYAGSVVSLIVLLTCLSAAIFRLVNPDYYALYALLTLME